MFMENYTIFLGFSIRVYVDNEKGYIVKVNLTIEQWRTFFYIFNISCKRVNFKKKIEIEETSKKEDE